MPIEAASNSQLILWIRFLALGFAVTVWFAESDETESPNGLLALNIGSIFALLRVTEAAVLIIYDFQIVQCRREIRLNAMCILALGFIAATEFVSFVYRRQSGHLVNAGVFALAAILIASENTQVAVFGLRIFAVVGLSLYKMFSVNAAKNERLTMGKTHPKSKSLEYPTQSFRPAAPSF